MVIWVITKIPINFCGYKTDKSTTDGKIHTSIVAQNLHHPDKHHRLLLPALSFSTFFQQLCYIITFQNEETKLGHQTWASIPIIRQGFYGKRQNRFNQS